MNIVIRQLLVGWILEGHPAGTRVFADWWEALDHIRGTVDPRFRAEITVVPTC